VLWRRVRPYLCESGKSDTYASNGQSELGHRLAMVRGDMEPEV
jgi:hypothetical protein